MRKYDARVMNRLLVATCCHPHSHAGTGGDHCQMSGAHEAHVTCHRVQKSAHVGLRLQFANFYCLVESFLVNMIAAHGFDKNSQDLCLHKCFSNSDIDFII